MALLQGLKDRLEFFRYITVRKLPLYFPWVPATLMMNAALYPIFRHEACHREPLFKLVYIPTTMLGLIMFQIRTSFIKRKTLSQCSKIRHWLLPQQTVSLDFLVFLYPWILTKFPYNKIKTFCANIMMRKITTRMNHRYSTSWHRGITRIKLL